MSTDNHLIASAQKKEPSSDLYERQLPLYDYLMKKYIIRSFSSSSSGSLATSTVLSQSTALDTSIYTIQLNALKLLLSTFSNVGPSNELAYKQCNVKNGKLNYIEINKKSDGNDKKKTLVLCHGYASGLGFFFQNYDHFSQDFDRVIAVDWNGMGMSAAHTNNIKRSPLLSFLYIVSSTLSPSSYISSKIRKHHYEANKKSIDFFTDSLEEFRKETLKDTTFVLAGHSLGAYLCGQYTAKYPSFVDSLILISPVGIDSQPQEKEKTLDIRRNFVQMLWHTNFTPQTILKGMLILRGSDFTYNFVKKTFSRRFGNRWENDQLETITRYFYLLTINSSIGEYALNSLLDPIVTKQQKQDGTIENRVRLFAHTPLVETFAIIEKKLPILTLYGDTDWLAYADVMNDMKKLR